MAESFVGNALQYLGGLTAIDKLKEHLASQVITALMTIEEQKLFEHYGYGSFKDFLEGSDLSNMSKTQYYRLRELFLKEGPEQYDLFTSWKIPLKTRRLLQSGDVVIEGDEAVIGGTERIVLSDGGVGVKRLVERLVKDKIAVEKALDKSDKEINRLADVEVQFKKLETEIEEAKEKPAYMVAYLNAVEAVRTLTVEVRDLPGELKAERVATDMDHFGELFRQLYEAYGESFISWLANQNKLRKTR